ncbi:MAG: carboxypeptidase M32 [Clostridia bacterium]|nr:carboxypeptidase M32 [Clostridia bacterium]
MKEITEKSIKTVYDVLDEVTKIYHAVTVMNFDLETICPSGAMERQGDTMAYLQTEAYKRLKSEEFIAAAEQMYLGRDEEGVDPLDAVLAESLHREYMKIKNVTPEMSHEFSLIRNKAYVDWLKAKQSDDYSVFAPSLEKIRDIGRKEIELRDDAPKDVYDAMLDDYERGITSADLDETFGVCKERLLPLLEKIKKSKKTIRRDFLTRRVPDERQRKMSRYLLETMNYDFTRGAFTTTEHPFTSDLARDDVRVTTHYYPEAFTSSMYSIIHEGGHALFGQLQPSSNHDHHIESGMTMGMHESVSRFYENRIGRSRAFIDLIYPRTKEIFPGLLDDVSPEEFYEGVNIVEPTLIRTEADEFTYTLHIIIRYEIEKMYVEGKVATADLPRLWREKYREYLGITPQTEKEGVLQDVHWSFGFGYFPTYALGNMYNAMYFNRMKGEIPVDSLVRSGDFKTLNGWMAENVFKRANVIPPKEWIREITGRDFTPNDFLDYLEEKYGVIYGL